MRCNYEVLYLSGYKSMSELASAEAENLREDINETMNSFNLSKQKFGLKDSKYLIEDANLYLKWLNL